MSDMASILGLILLAFTWLALRGMGTDGKSRRDDHPHSQHPHRR